MRAWIVCRSVTLRSIGENILVIHPDDVQMGVEERAQVFNQATGSLEDAREQPEPSPKVRYIDQNYDKVAQFHPELLHCKRMACLLAIARFLHKGVLQRKASTFSMPKSAIPRDFADNSVPVIQVEHRKGLQEEAELQRQRQHVNDLEKKVKALEAEFQQAKSRLDHQPVDTYSQTSVDAYNKMVAETKAAQERHNSMVPVFNQAVDACKKVTDAYNAANASCRYRGGVELEIRNLDVKPVNAEETEILKSFRPLAEEVLRNPEISSLLRQPHLKEAPSVLQDVYDQKDVCLNIWPVARPQPVQVILHSLERRADLNGSSGTLESQPEGGKGGKYKVHLSHLSHLDGVISVKRKNFIIPCKVQLFGLRNDLHNGKVGSIVGVRNGGTELRYLVRLSGREVAVEPKHVLLPVGTTGTIFSNLDDHGTEIRIQGLATAEKDKERKYVVELPSGQTLRIKAGNILA